MTTRTEQREELLAVERTFYRKEWDGVPATYVVGFMLAGAALLASFMPWVEADGDVTVAFAVGWQQIAAGLVSPSVFIEGQYAVFNFPSLYDQLGLSAQRDAATLQYAVPWFFAVAVSVCGMARALVGTKSMRLLGVGCLLVLFGVFACVLSFLPSDFKLTAWPIVAAVLSAGAAWCCFSTKPRPQGSSGAALHALRKVAHAVRSHLRVGDASADASGSAEINHSKLL